MSVSFETMASIRFGYGFRPGEAAPQNKSQLLDQVRIGIKTEPLYLAGGIEGRHEQIEELQTALIDLRSGRNHQTRHEGRLILQKGAYQTFQRDCSARLMQAVLSPNGFYERLATFWTNHFSTSADKSLQMRLVVPLYEAEAIRPHIGGSFRRLLRAATEHPAMLIYLDQSLSQGPDSLNGRSQHKGLNENLGRELLELHTLGAGSGYTQADVHSAALVLTGLTVDDDALATIFRPRLAEPGSHSVLGIGYGGEHRRRKDYRNLLDDLADHPRTAEHICRKLCIHFISDEPPADIVNAMVDAWDAASGNLLAVYDAMLSHPAAWRDEGSKARQPFDYIVTGLRALDSGGGDGIAAGFMQDNQDDDDGSEMAAQSKASDDNKSMDNAMAPPADGAGDTVSADATAEDRDVIKRRKAVKAARALGQGALRRMGQPIWLPPSPAGFEEKFDAWITASQLAERLAWARRASARFGKDQDPREFLKATLGDAARDQTIRVVSQAPNKISGLTLVLASPEFNRR